MAEATIARERAALFTRIALISGAALALAACQTSSGYDANGDLKTTTPMAKPNFPVRGEAAAAPAANLPVPPPSQAAAPPPRADPPPVTAGIVESKPLPPPAAQVALAPPPPPPPAQPPAPPPAQSAAPPMRTAAVTPAAPPAPIPPPRPSATGEVIGGLAPTTAAAGATYTVKSGQGLDAIARELGVTRQTLVEANDLKAPFALKPGEKLKVPGKAAPSPMPSRGGRIAQYVVAPGDTLFSIAKRFDTTTAEMVSLNDMKASESIHPGQKLTLPKKYQPQETRMAAAPPAQPSPPPSRVAAASPPPAPVTRPPVASPPPPPPAEARPAAPPPAQVVTVPRAQPAPPPAAPPSTPAGPAIERQTASAQQVRAAGSGKFVWPVKGRILSNFGPKADGQRNDGLDIAAPMNTPVKAAASGEVIYAGDVLREYGNLVLIQHPDGFVTAYGHLAKVNVKMKDKVSQDQEIGQVGDTGGVTQPQLHFETRYARSAADSPAPPVDPMLVLPNP